MHVAEQPAEIQQCLAEHGLTPVELLHQHGILDSSFTAIHAIHIGDLEIEHLGAARTHICACPTTERNLGDGPVLADQLSAAGAEICFGSDSNVQIDLLEDARALEYHLRMLRLGRACLSCNTLFSAATGVGYAALGQTTDTEDYFTLDLEDPSLAGLAENDLVDHVMFCAGRVAVRDVFVAGKQVVHEGRHPLQDEIVSRFKAVQRRLWD